MQMHHDVHWNCMANGRLQEERNIEQMDRTGVQRTNGRPHIIVLHMSIKEKKYVPDSKTGRVERECSLDITNSKASCPSSSARIEQWKSKPLATT